MNIDYRHFSGEIDHGEGWTVLSIPLNWGHAGMSTRGYFETTVVFADVAGSSRLYKEQGDQEANRQISEIVSRMMRVTSEHNGVVIKTIGDELMCHFPHADDAFTAAVAFQQIGTETLPLRIGMAFGKVIEKDADIFGEAVNDAAAVVKMARGRQIIVTEAFREQLPGSRSDYLSRFDDVRLKGGEKNTRIYRIEWESILENSIPGPQPTMIMSSWSTEEGQLLLDYKDSAGGHTSLTLSPEDVPIHIGRDSTTCRVSFASPLASRDHCHIDFRFGKFVLVDHSTNGTYILGSEGSPIYLRREEIPLIGEGEISLGEEVSGQSQFILKYRC